MKSKVVTFSNYEWLPHTGDFDTIVFGCNIVDREYFETAVEKQYMQQQSLSIRFSGTALHFLKLEVGNPSLDKIAFQVAKIHLATKIKQGLPLTNETIQFSSENIGQHEQLEHIEMQIGIPLEFPMEKKIGF